METTTNWEAYFPMPNDRNKERLLWLAEKNDFHEIQMKKFLRFIDSFDDSHLMYLVRVGLTSSTAISNMIFYMPRNKNKTKVTDRDKIKLTWAEDKNGNILETTIDYHGNITNVIIYDEGTGWRKVPEILSDFYSAYIEQIKKYLNYE